MMSGIGGCLLFDVSFSHDPNISTPRENLQLAYDNDPDKQFFLESTEMEERKKDNTEENFHYNQWRQSTKTSWVNSWRKRLIVFS